jgi:hypothetical protein
VYRRVVEGKEEMSTSPFAPINEGSVPTRRERGSPVNKDAMSRLKALKEELTHVLEEAVQETLPLVRQQDVELRDLEKAIRAKRLQGGYCTRARSCGPRLKHMLLVSQTW